MCDGDRNTCKHFGICGGCKYMDLSYEEQLKLKADQVKGLLEGPLSKQDSEWIFEGIKPSPIIEGYRNKMEFSFGDSVKDGPLELGMHQKGSFYNVITVDGCQIVDESYRIILSHTRDYFDGLTPYHKKKHTGYLRHLMVRKAVKTGEILIALVTASAVGGMTSTPTAEEEVKLLSGWQDMLLGLELPVGHITGIIHIVNDTLSDTVQADRMDVLYGRDYINEELLGLRFKISVFSFFQTNSLGAEVLYDTARSYIGDLSKGDEPSDTVYDLYSGTGTIAQLMAPVAKKVIGVEIVEEAVEAARENAATNGLDNCEFIAGDVLAVLDGISEKPDFIILDPPRDGINPKALKKIIDYGVDRLVYISCKPTSLARDLESFVIAGYEVEKAVCVDMFPFTQHVETVCLLSKLHEAKHYVSVTLDMDEMDITSAESKATYEDLKKYVAEHNDGMKVSNLYIAQVKRKCGLELAENFNLPKSEDSRQSQCPKEKEEAIMEALRHYRMI